MRSEVSRAAPGGAARGGVLPWLRRRPRRLAHRVGERREDETHVADDRVAHGRAGGLVGVAGDLDQFGPGRQQRAGLVLVIAEHRRAGDQH